MRRTATVLILALAGFCMTVIPCRALERETGESDRLSPRETSKRLKKILKVPYTEFEKTEGEILEVHHTGDITIYTEWLEEAHFKVTVEKKIDEFKELSKIVDPKYQLTIENYIDALESLLKGRHNKFWRDYERAEKLRKDKDEHLDQYMKEWKKAAKSREEDTERKKTADKEREVTLETIKAQLDELLREVRKLTDRVSKLEKRLETQDISSQ